MNIAARNSHLDIANMLYNSEIIKNDVGVEVAELPPATTDRESSPDSRADNHKAEILATRKGGFGSSDASMIIDIATIGKVMPKHYKRLAVFKGIIEPDNFSTTAMETGNQREREIFEYYTAIYPTYKFVSNPMIYDDKNLFSNRIKCFTHIDMIDASGCIYEIKTSQKDTEDLVNDYDAQLKWHCLLAKKNNIVLLHYKEKHDGADFDLHNINYRHIIYSADDLAKFTEQIRAGLQIIKAFLLSQEANDYADLREHCKDKKSLININYLLHCIELHSILQSNKFSTLPSKQPHIYIKKPLP